jgi:hypothetical protein
MRLQKLTGNLVAAGAAYLAQAKDFGKTILLDTLAGSVVTLPPATGSGGRIRVFERVAATSAAHKVQVANGNDVMAGNLVIVASAGTPLQFATVAASDTVTLNRTTSGGATNGAWMEFDDVAPNLWAVKGALNGSGVATTPFSAAVN